MKRLILTLVGVVLLASPVMAKEFCFKDIGDAASNCQIWGRKVTSAGIVRTLRTTDGICGEYDDGLPGFQDCGFYPVVRDPAQVGPEWNERYNSDFTYTWNAPSEEFYKLEGVTAVPERTLQWAKDQKIAEKYNEVDALLSEPCQYPDENGYLIPMKTRDKLFFDWTRSIVDADGYWVYDLDLEKYTRLDIPGATQQAKLDSMKTALQTCRADFQTAYGTLTKDDPATTNAECTALDDPWDCCTDLDSGNCDIDGFIQRINAASTYGEIQAMQWSQSIAPIGTP